MHDWAGEPTVRSKLLNCTENRTPGHMLSNIMSTRSFTVHVTILVWLIILTSFKFTQLHTLATCSYALLACIDRTKMFNAQQIN